MHKVAAGLLKLTDAEVEEQAPDNIRLSTSYVNPHQKVAESKINKLFRIEYLYYTQSNELEMSLSIRRTNYFFVPMSKIVPVMEEIYEENKGYIDRMVTGKLPKLQSSVLRDDPDNYRGLFYKIMCHRDPMLRHPNEIRLMDSLPKYLTFYFDY